MSQTNVAVIGAGGHVGLGLALSMADAGHRVRGVDISAERVREIEKGIVPFVEEGAETVLHRVLENGCLKMTTDASVVSECDVVILILGTPIDENLNPVLEPLHEAMDDLEPHLRKGQLIVLRSTVSPGTTDSVRKRLEKRTGWRVGEDLHLVFAPERVVQGKSLEEIRSLPQIIGTYDRLSYRRASEFFSSFIDGECIQLTPLEAELAKLMCNMARYSTFAIANEFYLIADEYNANIHKIFDACSKNYPRFNLPTPGPNVSGPCLFKDGFFLAQWFPFPEIILTSFKINESMPVHLYKKIKARRGLRKVSILGMTFKAGNDDTRYSLSFKLKKLLEGAGYEVTTVDPFLDGMKDLNAIRNSDCVVLMTPHEQFYDLRELIDIVDNDDCWFMDIWGCWEEMRHASHNGCFSGREVPQTAEVLSMA